MQFLEDLMRDGVTYRELGADGGTPNGSFVAKT
jgi:hypothetical protein